jgi:hypothetical protein
MTLLTVWQVLIWTIKAMFIGGVVLPPMLL